MDEKDIDAVHWLRFLGLIVVCVTVFFTTLVVLRHLDKRVFIGAGYVEKQKIDYATYWTKEA